MNFMCRFNTVQVRQRIARNGDGSSFERTQVNITRISTHILLDEMQRIAFRHMLSSSVCVCACVCACVRACVLRAWVCQCRFWGRRENGLR